MRCYRPTTLKLASAHCPRAVDFYEQNAPAFRDHFAVGIAAHDASAVVRGRSDSKRADHTAVGRRAQRVSVLVGVWRYSPSAVDGLRFSDLALAYAQRPDVTWASTGRSKVGVVSPSTKPQQ